MNQARWQTIEEIYHSAYELEDKEERSFFLDNACGADAELRREVDTLLAQNIQEDDFLSNSGFSLGLSLLAGEQRKTLVGESIGPYKIIKLVGRGGMGEVYLALDQRLARQVALKVLPPFFVNKTDVDRFKNEARLAANINHPGICTIYEIDENGKRLFIAMEFVEGVTLRERLRGKSLAINQAIDIALQTASALAVAHEKGIVHRDIKPENIIVRPDGLVKVVDFGLAKLTARDSSIEGDNHNQTKYNQFVPQLAHTEPGILMGTANYMSPEQARGKDTDARTDVWSLGVVLYEMIAGEKLFQGETSSDVIASVLRNELPSLPHNTPTELSGIIKKSLQKNAEDRYPSANDFWLDLKKLEYRISVNESYADNLDSPITNKNQDPQMTDGAHYQGSVETDPSRIALNIKSERAFHQIRIHYRFVALSLGLILLVVVAAKFGVFKLTGGIEPPDMFQKMHLKRLTAKGIISDENTAISRDGKYAVYVVREGSLRSLWLKQIATFADMQIVAPAEVEYYSLNFSRDGNYIYYSVFANKKSTELYQIPSLGGIARKLSDDVGDGHVTLSPDNDRIAFVRDERFLITANLDGSHPQTVSSAPDDGIWVFPTWSPDGEIIILGAFSRTGEHLRLIEVAVSDGRGKKVDCPPWYRVSGIAWLPDKSGLVISGRDSETKLSQLWMLGYPTGKLRRITNDLNNYKAAGVTGDGKNIISVQQERVSNIYVVPNIDSEPARKITFERGTDDGMSGIALTSDSRVIYTSNKNGYRDLWIVNRDGSNHRQLTFNLQYSVFPAVSPDDRYVAFVSDQTGAPNIWRIDLRDGSLKQLTFGSGVATYPNFSPDGRSIFYQYTENNKPSIWKVGIDGENPIQVIEGSLTRPALSPNGKFIVGVYKENPDASDRIAVFSPAGGKHPIKLLDLPAIVNTHNFRWSTDGQSLIYIDSRNGFYNLWSQPLNGDQPKQITNFKSGQIFRFAQSRDGREFVLAQAVESSDVIMINNFD
jgi:serine/threonine protein kinase/Tol biopolymer transport system component